MTADEMGITTKKKNCYCWLYLCHVNYC